MDAYQQQHHHQYMRPIQQQPPPPPSNSDLHHQQYLHHQPRPPVPPQATWYSSQFQYHPPPPSSHSPSPPPQQWPAPAPPAYPPPPPLPPHPYPTHHHFPPPPPPRPPHSLISQSYPQANQEWGNSNWSQQQQGWDYQAHSNAEDWAARARAWAAQKSSTEDQYPQSQYQQTTDSHYQDFQQQQQFPVSAYQQFPAAPSHQQPISYLQDNASFNSGGPSSNVPDGRMPYAVGVGTSAGPPTTSPSVLQQEVPSSYSSVTGKEEVANQKDQLYKLFPSSVPSTHEGQHHIQPSQPAVGGSALMEQPFAYGNQGADPNPDLSDQPLDFAPSFTRDQDPHMQSSYAAHDSTGNARGLGPVTPSPYINSWTPTVATGAAYAPIPSGLSSGHQHDPSAAMPSPVSGQAAPPFGSFPGPNFQPTIPAVGLSYGVGTGSALHPTTGFPGDAYGVSNLSERPKKASVPNWLKEEIIKNASVITRSSLEPPKEGTQSIEDEGVDRSYGKGDQADSKSIDSSRSTEEEDEDEDDDEAARTAAINQEIKRVLTEVLLKVTDELFDEIATKVLDEHDPTVEVKPNVGAANHKVSPSPPEVPTPKASAKVLVPVKAKEPETEDVSEKSSSGAPGNVLGLANYASDDDGEDDEIKSSSISNSRRNDVLKQSNTPKFSKDVHDVAENGSTLVELGKNSKQTNLETDLSKTSSVESKKQINAAISDLSEQKSSSKVVSQASDVVTTNESGSRATLGDNVADESQDEATKMKLDEDSQHGSKRSYSGKDVKDAELNRENEKGDGKYRKEDETHPRNEKKVDRNGLKEKSKERGDKSREKAKESESRKRSHLDAKEDRKESEKLHRSNAKEDDNRKRGRTKDKEEDRVRHKPTNDSSRHKRRRSSSTSSRGRNSRDKDSSDEVSDSSKRKTRSRKRNLSPSPVRSSRRQVSRSPHSKHSQRRHSPYSSIETTRRRRSKSKSPVRRRR